MEEVEQQDEGGPEQLPTLDLPDEVWVVIFGLLEPIHTASVTLTCRRWRAVFHSDPPLWRHFHHCLLGGPLVPAILYAPPLPEYCVRVSPATTTATVPGQRRLKLVEREAWFGECEWRAAVEWKVKRVREWGVTPEGRIEWAARFGCTRLVSTLLKRHGHELCVSGRLQAALSTAFRAAVCANDTESAEVVVLSPSPFCLPPHRSSLNFQKP
jgi:hypothetical protein